MVSMNGINEWYQWIVSMNGINTTSIVSNYIYNIDSLILLIYNLRSKMLNELNLMQMATTKCLRFNNYEPFFQILIYYTSS